ncbi:MAG: mechanosensitive ion channel [Bacteroidota bacterium]
MLNKVIVSVTSYLEGLGLSNDYAVLIIQVVGYVVLFVFAYLMYKLTVKVLRGVLLPLISKSETHFDDILLKNRFFIRIAYLIPASIIYFTVEYEHIFVEGAFSSFIKDVSTLFFYLISILIFDSLLSSGNDYYKRFHVSRDHPINGVIQVGKIIVYLVGLLGIIGFLFNKDLSSIFVGLGTLSAVLMLIFKDPILGFVGGLQLVFNKMVSIGDWINMPKFGADGTVLEISLTSVKIENFDKTIVTVPTYSLVSSSFQNYRGMVESGGRRIKRSINIDMDTVKFCTEEMLAKYKTIDVLKWYIDKTEDDISNYNTTEKIDLSVLVNGRRQTNLGVFRAYLKAYLRSRADVNNNMTFLVRHLQPTETGIPIQIYVFAATTDWGKYEDVQADIFDHVLAVIPEFDLKVFQYPSSGDFLQLISENRSYEKK